MAECHQCKKDAERLRSGPCSVCFSKSAGLCANCAFWEWGPPLVPPGPLPAELFQESPIVPCNMKRDLVLALIGKACPRCLDQLGASATAWGPKLPELVNGALEVYAKHYAWSLVTELAKDGVAADHVHAMMATLLTVSLGARLQATRPYNEAQVKEGSDPVLTFHRFDAPLLAWRHLRGCFWNQPELLHEKLRELGRAALLCEEVELLLRGKLSIAMAHQRLLAAESDPRKAKQLLLVALCIYHGTAAVRPVDQERGNFDPRNAYGWMSEAHRAQLLAEPGGGGRPLRKEQAVAGAAPTIPSAPPLLTEAARTRVGTLYLALELPLTSVRERYADDGTIEPSLSEKVKRYLRSLPRMDHTSNNRAQATACEATVRATVLARLQEIFTLLVPRAGAAAPIASGGQAKRVGLFYPNLFSQMCEVKKPAQMEELLDKLLDALNSGSLWIETSTSEGLFDAYLASKARPRFQLLNESTLNLKETRYRDVFPSCAAGAVPGEAESFPAIHFQRSSLDECTDGRQLAMEHYLDWRHDKDRVLYSLSDFALADLPVFASCALWSGAPRPKLGYGFNMLVFDPRRINFSRSVITLNDFGRPCRSMLLLLQDVLTGIPGLDGGRPDAAKGRLRVLDEILMQVDANGVIDGRRDPLARLQAKLGAELKKVGDKNFWASPSLAQTLTILEVHVFGPVKIEGDALGAVICTHHSTPAQESADNTKLIGALRAALPAGVPVFEYTDAKGMQALAGAPLQAHLDAASSAEKTLSAAAKKCQALYDTKGDTELGQIGPELLAALNGAKKLPAAMGDAAKNNVGAPQLDAKAREGLFGAARTAKLNELLAQAEALAKGLEPKLVKLAAANAVAKPVRRSSTRRVSRGALAATRKLAAEVKALWQEMLGGLDRVNKALASEVALPKHDYPDGPLVYALTGDGGPGLGAIEPGFMRPPSPS